jgi:hypothetical protein
MALSTGIEIQEEKEKEKGGGIFQGRMAENFLQTIKVIKS